MANKKAFARYANNKIVPGSLIVREKAPKVGVWKEIAYDLCCNGGCDLPPVTLTVSGITNDTIPGDCLPYFRILCGINILLDFNRSNAAFFINSMVDLYNAISTSYSWLGTWSIDGEMVTLELNGNIAKQMCPDEVLILDANPNCVPP